MYYVTGQPCATVSGRVRRRRLSILRSMLDGYGTLQRRMLGVGEWAGGGLANGKMHNSV